MNYKICFFVSIPFLLLGVALIVFGIYFFEDLIIDQVKGQAVLVEDTSDLWAKVPGKSKVALYKDHYFFSIPNVEDIIYKNQKATAVEYGPFRVSEYDNLINREYNGNYTDYNFFRYYSITPEENKTEMETQISSLNIVFYFFI